MWDEWQFLFKDYSQVFVMIHTRQVRSFHHCVVRFFYRNDNIVFSFLEILNPVYTLVPFPLYGVDIFRSITLWNLSHTFWYTWRTFFSIVIYFNVKQDHGLYVTNPLGPPLYQLLKTISILAGDHLVVPIGVSHDSSWLQEYNQGSGRKRTKNKRTIWAWVNSSARRLSCDTLHSWCICRLTQVCILAKFLQSYQECQLILTGLPSLLLDPISCRLVSSAVGYRLATATLRLP